MPSIVLDALETSDTFHTVAATILVLLVAQAIFRLVKSVLDALRSASENRTPNRFYHELIKKMRSDDYALSYDEEYDKIQQRAFKVLGNGANGSPTEFLFTTATAIGQILCFLLFGTVISRLSPWIILLLVVGSLVNILCQRWQQNQDHILRDEQNANRKKMNYLTWFLPVRHEYGKDIRAYNYLPLLDEKGDDAVEESIHILRRKQNYNTVVSVISMLISALRDGIAYLYLIQGVIAGDISSVEFVLYFSAISQLSGFISGIIDYFSSMYQNRLSISDVIVFLEGDFNKLNHGKGIPLPKGRPLSIEFRNVTYKYPRGEKNVLENISFKIEPGEKISLVGLNGAGKTTLTRLMCGLVVPDEGEVLIDGHSVLEYNRDELYTLFSIVPQQYTILPTSIAENIAVCPRDEVDEKRLWECLERANIADRIRTLKNGIDTGMNKQFDVDAANFSGGEMQRLLLARALYRSAEILILDEPTAALDPIAEDKMYHMYGDIADNATSVFISHRLASTRFCDRIYFLDGAHFAECGTHEELMALGGKYKELFDVQSQYYKEEAANESQK
ncbi:MAG: ABC transporter ATP-binding protein [Clostridia bacterium]|nr:ABC transporter ATP-binding protein [Clostridia bacterium]